MTGRATRLSIYFKPAIIVFYTLIVLFSCQLPFFWDNILLSSRFAGFFYENGLNGLILSPQLDCGHPPFFGLYLSGIWKVLGKSLWVSHLAMLPLLILMGFHYLKLARYFLAENLVPFALLLLFFEPSLLAQSTMVTSEIVVVLGGLMALNGILYKRRSWLIIGGLIMCMVNLRGIIWVISLFALDMAWEWRKNDWSKRATKLIPYFIVTFLVLGWHAYHYIQTGWMLQPPSSVWEANHGMAGFGAMFKNLAFTSWRFLDFGRVFVWIIATILLIYGLLIRKPLWNTQQKRWLQVFLILSIVFVGLVVLRSNSTLHRYFLLLYLLAGIGFVSLLSLFKVQIQRIAIILAVLALTTGHLWVYPDRIAQGWDASLAHLPYFDLSNEMKQYIEHQQIDESKVATAFPGVAPLNTITLETTDYKYSNTYSKAFNEHNFILQSNVHNDFTDNQLQLLETDWLLLKELKQGSVYLRLYQNPATATSPLQN